MYGICLPVYLKSNLLEKIEMLDCLSGARSHFYKKIFTKIETMRPSSTKALLEGDRLTIFLPPDRVDDLERKFKV